MVYLEDTQINRDLVLDFFLCFSRFEFALKAAGYVLGNETRVFPNWKEFARDISRAFLKDRTPELYRACESYLLNPPNKQVLNDRTLAWSTDLPENTEGDVEQLIELVKRVRNNLFHGGKYNAQLHEETARNEELLRGGLLILNECLRVSDEVRREYEGARI